MGLGEPSPWVWLRDGTDRLFHAVSVWELPPRAPPQHCSWPGATGTSTSRHSPAGRLA